MQGSWPPYTLGWPMNPCWPPNVSAATLSAFPQMPPRYPQMPWPTNVALVVYAHA
jgi:hypothetical protein